MRRTIAGAMLPLLSAVALGWSQCATAEEGGRLYGIRAIGSHLIVRSLDIEGFRSVEETGKLPRAADERLAAIFQSRDRAMGMIRTKSPAASSRRGLVRMLGLPERVIDVSTSELAGLRSEYAVSSLIVPAIGAPIALVSHFTDTPPYWLATVDFHSGAVSLSATALDPRVRYARLTQCPDGRVYAVASALQAETRLVQLELDRGIVTPLQLFQVGDEPLRTGVVDLACGPAGQLYALADPTYSGINSVFSVNTSTAQMKALVKFDVDRMTFVH
jgi:hypothetical protein